MPSEALCDQMFDAVTCGGDSFALAAHFPAARLTFVQRPKVFFKAGQAVSAHCRGPIDVTQSFRLLGLRPAKYHSSIDILRPDGQPDAAADGALAQLLPLGQFNDGPLHHGIVVNPRPAQP
jgi:hypothetical protein